MTSMPSYPSGPDYTGDAVSPRLAPPADVLLSVKLWFASILVGLVGGILVFALSDQTQAIADLRASNASGLTEDQIESAVTLGITIALVLAVVMLALQVFFVFKMRAGRNWARIVLAILGGLSILSSLTSLASAMTVGSAINFVSLLLLIAAMVFMFRPTANAYFSQPKA
ncbi:hypothetical protein [Pengzhenrongella sicca]|uniref:Uncharacterized protein n=1 Tax=Pengzhenrongella sicca TaxID=2819238 RepID=A0A8A4ZBM7_9MICO|nr:hypothetical protein [Pengzhenrongella sicca]QTE28283.1 hypothetical protein J4E96_12930 [Pengzhenrongella sicca]